MVLSQHLRLSDHIALSEKRKRFILCENLTDERLRLILCHVDSFPEKAVKKAVRLVMKVEQSLWFI